MRGLLTLVMLGTISFAVPAIAEHISHPIPVGDSIGWVKSSQSQQLQWPSVEWDIEQLEGIGQIAVAGGDAEKWSLDRDQHRLDLTLGSTNPQVADTMCSELRQIVNRKGLSREWRVRVYLLNGQVGAECRLVVLSR